MGSTASGTLGGNTVGSIHQNEGFQLSEPIPKAERNSTYRRNDPQSSPKNKKHRGWGYWDHIELDWL